MNRFLNYPFGRSMLPAILLAVGMLSGCATSGRQTWEPVPDPVPAVVVIDGSRWQHPATNAAGVSGWFVPAAVHAEMMEALELLEYYRNKEGAKK